MKTLLTTVAAIAISASAASAVTVLSGESTGRFVFDPTVPNITLNGTGEMSVFQPLDATRDYTLNFHVMTDPDPVNRGPSYSYSGSISATFNVADDLNVVASDPTMGEFSYGAYVMGKYFDLAQSGNTYSGSLEDVILSSSITNYLVDGLGRNAFGGLEGKYEMSFELVAAEVPLPAGLPLLGLGLGAVAFAASRKKKQAA
ncbi:MAG: hypothetical protein ACU0DK_01400 [Pseudooceanicola sp.]